ncbi:MAG: hypothetical protein QM758_19710 [Armatimonas sp.]
MTRKLLGVAFSALLISGVLARPQDPPPPVTDPAAAPQVPAEPQKQEIPAAVKEVWDAAETWTLYSLAPEQKLPAVPDAARGTTKAKPNKKPAAKPPAKKRDAEPPFHGVVVLGKRELKKEDAIATSLKEAIYASIEKSGKPARCFIPHHGIRAVVGDKTVDLVICFTCHYMDIYVNGEKLGNRLVIDPAPFTAFDQALTEAQVPMGQRGVKKPPVKK